MSSPKICVTLSASKDIFRTTIPKSNEVDEGKRELASPILLLPIESKRILLPLQEYIPRGMSADSTDVDSPRSRGTVEVKEKVRALGKNVFKPKVTWADSNIPQLCVKPDSPEDRSPLERHSDAFMTTFSEHSPRKCVETIYVYTQTEIVAGATGDDSPSVVSFRD